MSDVTLKTKTSPPQTSSPSASAGGGAGIACNSCGKVSDSSTKFCGGCGARLWEPCPGCGTVNPIDVNFCGDCGTSLQESLDKTLHETEELIAKAQAHANEGRFTDAIRLLEGVELVDHTALEELSSRAESLAKEFVRQREEIVAGADQVLIDARALVEQGLIREAFAKAETVPPALRGLELQALYEELEAKVEELKRLRKIVKQSLAEKDYEAAYGSVARLLELDPQDEKMAELAAKLAKKQSQSEHANARKRLKAVVAALKACDYRAAEAELSEIPDTEFDEKTAKVLVGAKERVWLAFQLARTPFADETLVAVADRLAKLQPHDKKTAKLQAEVMRQWKEGVKKSPGQPVVWKKPSDKEDALGISLAGCPAPLARLLAKKGHAAGQFLVAYGLAMQAAGAAETDVNLAPQKQGWTSRFSLGRGRKKGGGVAWGVDIGTHSLKAVRLVLPEEEDAAPVVDDVWITPLDRQESDAASLPSGTQKAVQKLLAEHDFKNARIAVGLSGTLTLGRFFRLPWLSKAKFDEAVRYEVRARIPLDLEDVYFDHTECEVDLGDDDAGADLDGAKVMRVALVAANRQHVESRIALFADSGAESVAVTSDGLALANAHAIAAKQSGQSAGGSVALVDIGYKTANIAIVSDEGCWLRGLYYGGEAFDQQLVQQLKCSWQKAEEIRHKPSKAAWMHELDEALAPSFELGKEQIERTLMQYGSEEGKEISQVLLCGGAAAQFGFIRSLQAGE